MHDPAAPVADHAAGAAPTLLTCPHRAPRLCPALPCPASALQVFKAHITTSPSGKVADMFWLYDNRHELPENHRHARTQPRARTAHAHSAQHSKAISPCTSASSAVAALAFMAQTALRGATHACLPACLRIHAVGAGCWRCVTG